MNSAMGRPVADLDDFLEPAPEPALRAAPDPAPPALMAKRHAMWWIMAATSLLVAAGIGYWLTRSGESIDAAALPAPATSAIPQGVAGFAELYVATFLTGSAEDVAQFLPGGGQLGAMAAAQRYVTRAATMEVAATDSGYWSVVVAADVLALDAAGYVPNGLQYFQVGIVDDGGRLVATALPARVAAPPVRNAAPRSLQIADQPASDAVSALVADFIEGLLVGERDLARYLASTSIINPVHPPPYISVAVVALGLYDDGAALVTVEAVEANGASATLQYVLRLVDEGGGPAVAAILAGPPPIASGEQP